MAFHEDKRFPPGVPPSLNHNSFEMQNMKDEAPPKYDSAGDVTPYLGLRARLSQVWFNRWTILALLVLARVLILVTDLDDNIGSAKTTALSACTKVEDVGSAMASMPHYLSAGVNELAADGISKAVRGLVDLLGLVLTGIEQIILFVINMYIGTYLCLTTSLVHGTLDVAVDAVEETTDAFNSVIETVTDDISSAIITIQDKINATFQSIQSAASVFGDDLTAPDINITSYLDKLDNLQINTTSITSALDTLNATVPTYDEAENLTKTAISIPFNLIKTVLNDTYGNYTFDTSVFPTANKKSLTFCSDNGLIDDFFNALYSLVSTSKKVFIAVLVILAILACLPVAWFEIRRYRSQQRRARVLSAHGYDPMDVVYIASRPYSAGFGIRLATWLGGNGHGSAKRQLLVRWAVAYATSLPALFVLSLALAGFVTCLCDAALLHAIQAETPALTSEVGDFAADIVTSLRNVSSEWSDGANTALTNFQDDVNNDMLSYVTNATSAVNNTLNTFTDEIDTVLNDVFNGTVLEDVVTQLVRCLIGIKIDSIEEGLTWVHDHAQLSLPRFPDDVFSLGANESISGDSDLSSFLTSTSSVTSDELTQAVDKVVTFVHNSMIQEALLSTALILLYVIIILGGVVYAAVNMATHERTRAEGGQRYGEGIPGPVIGRGPPGGLPDLAVPAAAHNSSVSPFPLFHIDSACAYDDDAAASAHDDKLAAALSAQRVTANRTVETKSGYWRSSSYGDVDDAGSACR